MDKNNKTACGDVRGKIAEYIEEELNGAEREIVEAHISACEECRKEYSEQKRVCEALSAISAEPPAYLHSSIMKAVEKEKRAEKRMRIIRRLAMPAAAALLVVALIPAVLRGANGNAVKTPMGADPIAARYNDYNEEEYDIAEDVAKDVPAEDAVDEHSAVADNSSSGKSITPSATPSSPDAGRSEGGDPSNDTNSVSVDTCVSVATEEYTVSQSTSGTWVYTAENSCKVYIVSPEEFGRLLSEKRFLHYAESEEMLFFNGTADMIEYLNGVCLGVKENEESVYPYSASVLAVVAVDVDGSN